MAFISSSCDCFSADRVSYCAVFDSKEVETSSRSAFNFSIYSIEEETKGITIKDNGQIMQKLANEFLWSKNGIFFALVNKDENSSNQGILETGYLHKDNNKNYVPEIIRSYTNLSYMTHAMWDPSGRFIMTSSSTTKSY